MLNHVMALLVNKSDWRMTSPGYTAIPEPPAFAAFATAAIPANREDATALWPIIYRADMQPWTCIRDSRILKPEISPVRITDYVRNALNADVTAFTQADYGKSADSVAALTRIHTSASDALLKAAAAYILASLWLELKGGAR